MELLYSKECNIKLAAIAHATALIILYCTARVEHGSPKIDCVCKRRWLSLNKERNTKIIPKLFCDLFWPFYVFITRMIRVAAISA